MFDILLKHSGNLKNDVLAGLTAVLTLIPEAVAFTFVAGIDPMMGLYGSFFIGFITAVFGGRPAMISGAAGSMAVVTTAFIIMFGIEYLLAAVVLTGILQVLFGAFKMGKFIRLLPHPVMLGFVNGLAIVIGMAQFGQFKENTRVVYDKQNDMFTYAGDWMALTSPAMLTMMGMIVLTMLIVHFLPKFTKAIPAPLAAIVVCTLLATFTPLKDHSKRVSDVVFGQRTSMTEKEIITDNFDAKKETVLHREYVNAAEATVVTGTTPEQVQQRWEQNQTKLIAEGKKVEADALDGSLKGRLPSFHLPNIGWDMSNPENRDKAVKVFILALILASVGLIETLMTMSLIDEITETRGQGNRESVAQGSGNIVSGLFGGMCGCAMIGQSVICLNSGGRGRASGIATAIFMLIFILFAPQLIEMIPVASLIGVMFMVVIATFEWSSLRLFGKIPKSEILIIIIVSAVTVFLDLAVAVGIGIIISALIYAWNSAKEIKIKVAAQSDDEKTYSVSGNIFFGSITSFKELFDPSNDPKDVYIDFADSKVCDHSGIEAVHGLSERYKAAGKVLHLRHLSPECAKLLKKAGDIVEVNILEDPKYHVADDALA
ncbi:TonB-dependent receptor [Lentisphaera araneosa HTCC2155]|uniref:TonB-dependent receptor n=1 Tax=Lentisphaera araneosa HTCC2155 TaxID=313628 RepID=A6DPY0_9BACT|nr:SulP family inorganic anion transporter [Lentisphaera araneosa]EDM26221.1 TonB-dependent receptor [Lentisphaera araneosa HTCC2155]